MRIALSIVFFYTLVAADAITLDTIAVDETVLPAGSYVLSSDEALETNSITLQDRLARDVAFSVTSDLVGDEAVSFRGLNFKATEYVEDGIPLYRSANGIVDTRRMASTVEMYMNDGSGASSFGVSPMGGEVRLASSRPKDSFESRLDTTLSSNDEYYHGYVGSRMGSVYIQADADVYHRSDYALSDHYEATPVQGQRKRINSDKNQQSVSLKSGVYVGEQTHLAAKVSLTKSEYGLPPNVHTDLTAPVWDAFSRIAQKDMKSFYLYADHDMDSVGVSLRAYYDDYEDIFKIYDDLSYQTFDDPVVTYDDSRLGTVLKANLKEESYETTLVLLAEENEHIRSGGREFSGALMPMVTFQNVMLKGSLIHVWHFSESWRFDGALSYTLLQAKEAADASAAEPADNKEALDALAKITYENDQSTLYGSIAKKSRMPTMNEMFTFFPSYTANPELKPERSVQSAIGYQQMVAERSLIDFSIYYYDIKDLIIYRNSGYINREAAKHYGAEVRTESTYFSRQLIRVSYAYTHAVDSEGEALELIPEHQVKIEDTVTIAREWEGYLGYRFLGSRFSSNTATYTDEQKKLSGYHLVDLQVNYTPDKQVTVRAGIKNLLDEAYEWRYGFPAEGRSFYMSLEWVI